jgi:hypothetical protein
MGKIITTGEGLTVIIGPEELSKETVYDKEMKPIGLVDNVIRRVAWSLLWKYGGSKVKGKTFAYGELRVVDGKFEVEFHEVQFMPVDPGPP